jgi:hypothetical protein
MCGSRQWASDVWSLSLAAFSFPSPADAEPPRGLPPAVKLRETARVGPETCAAPMSGRSTRGKGKSAAAAGKDASGIPAAAATVAEEEGEEVLGSDEESFAEVVAEPTDLSAAEAAQAAAATAAAVAAERVKALKAVERVAADAAAAAASAAAAARSNQAKYLGWVEFVEDDANGGQTETLARYWKLIERADSQSALAAAAARDARLDEQRRSDLVRQDQRDATTAATIAELRAELKAVKEGSKPDEEPAFREFAARADDNPYGELRCVDPAKQYANEPKLQRYSDLGSGNRDPAYELSAKGRNAAQVARHAALTKDLSVAEVLWDATAELVAVVPDILVLFKGDDTPLDSLAEASDEYIALSAISRCYNSLRALHDNILQPAINYHQLWPIVQDYVLDKSNNLKELDVVKIMSALEGPIAGKAFGGTTLPTNLSTAWEKSIAAMEEKHNEKLLKNIAAARVSSPRTPFARSESSSSIGSTYESRRRSEAYSSRSSAPSR